MVILGHNLGNNQVSVNRTIGPTLVYFLVYSFFVQSVHTREHKTKIPKTDESVKINCDERYFYFSQYPVFSSPEPKAHKASL